MEEPVLPSVEIGCVRYFVRPFPPTATTTPTLLYKNEAMSLRENSFASTPATKSATTNNSNNNKNSIQHEGIVAREFPVFV